MDSCLLCLELNKELFEVIKADSIKWQELNIKQIVEKHFWPLTTIKNSSWLCLKCWKEVNEFHQFYSRIEEAHVRFEIIKVEETPVECKIEEDNFEYYFQEPEIKENNIGTVVDPLEKYKNLKSKNTETFKIEFLKESSSPVNKTEEEIEIQEERHGSDGSNEPDTYCDSEHDEVYEKPEKTSINEKKKSNDKGRIKREENDKFIAEHFKEINCDICKSSFETFPALQRHFTKAHNQRGYLICCKRKFHDRTRLIDHLLAHVSPDHYKCKECGKSMSGRISFKNHMLRVHRAHEVVRKHSCNICGKSFIKAYVLRIHMLKHLPEEEKKFPCLKCGRNYASAYILNQHQQAVHLKRFAKICDVCGKSFNSNVELKAHMNKHEGIPTPVLTCDVCGLHLTTARGLKLHKENQHPIGGKQEHPCPICAKVSPNITALRKHINTMHGKGHNHKCAICEKVFKRAETLKEHMAIHTGNALYTCPWCPMKFNSNGNRCAHRKKMHPKEWAETQLQKYKTNIPVQSSNTPN